MTAATDLTPRDYAALSTIAIILIGAVGAIARWSTRRVAGNLELLVLRFEQHVTDTTETHDREERARAEQIGVFRGSIEALARDSRSNAEALAWIRGNLQQAADLRITEFEHTHEELAGHRAQLADIGRALSAQLEARIKPLESEVEDIKEHGCALAKFRGGNGDLNFEPCP